MTPLYIAATDTIIRDPAHRYVHPTTGEVYGRSDWDNPQKRAEVGAVLLRESMPADGCTAESWEVVEDPETPGGMLRRPTREIPPDIEAIKTNAVDILKVRTAALLRETDWRMLRAIERHLAESLDEEGRALAQEREALRLASDALEADVYEASTLSEVTSASTGYIALEAEAMSLEAVR